MTSEDWAVAASVGQVVAALFAVPSAVFVGFQVWAARRSSDLTSLLAFHKNFAEHERRLLTEHFTDREHAFVEFLNLIEAYAGAYNGRLLNKSTKDQVYERIRDAVAVIELSPDRMDSWSHATSTPMAFSETRRFVVNNRAAIDRSKREILLPATSLESLGRNELSH